MTGSAVKRRVRAEKRETILVVVDLLHRDVPAIHRVTLLAACAKLSLMNVCVAVGALGSHIGKN